MSAWITTQTHVKSIVAWASKHDVYGVKGSEQEVAQMLHNENVKSVNHRYSEDTAPDVIAWDGKHVNLRAIEVIKSCQCLEYQSCEHDEWESSRSKVLLDRIVNKAISLLPGYDKAPWGIADPTEEQTA